MPLELNLGDVLRLKRPHPCGGTDWEVTRLGADIGLRCLTCNRRLMLERSVLERRLKQFVSRSDAPESQSLANAADLDQDEARIRPSRSRGGSVGET